MRERYVAAKLDRAALIRTALTLLGLGAALILILIIRQIAPAATLFALPLIVVPLYAYAAAPSGYAIDEGQLYIERALLGPKTIPLAAISACHPLPRAALRGTIRLYGTGGLFGWTGRCQAPQVGKFRLYATSLDRLIIIQRHKRRAIVISPADMNGFLTGLRRQYDTLVVPSRPRNVR